MSIPTEVTKVLKKAPYDLILYFFFALTVVTFSYYLDYDTKLHNQLVPYLGWRFGISYMFPVFLIPLMLFTSKATEFVTLTLLRSCVLLYMYFEAYDGVQDYLSVTPEAYTNHNPYLRYDALTPIYTIAVPSFWALLMVVMLGVSFIHYRKAKAKI
jgi:hypothetical protein